MQHFVVFNCFYYERSGCMEGSLLCADKEIAELYNQYVDMIYQISFMYLKNKADAEDAVQTTFIKLLNYKKPFQNEEHIKAWLIRTASNYCKNHLKHWWRTNTEIDTIYDYGKNDTKDETLETLLKLPEKYKTIIYLYYYMGYSTEEIAQILKQKHTTVRSLLSRGRKRLKDSLEGEFL